MIAINIHDLANVNCGITKVNKSNLKKDSYFVRFMQFERPRESWQIHRAHSDVIFVQQNHADICKINDRLFSLKLLSECKYLKDSIIIYVRPGK